MPSLGADMDEGALLEWLVAPGDTVERGQVIAVIDTAKSAIEAEVFEAGTVAELLVEPGTRCPVGTPLARIEEVGAPPAKLPAPPLRHLMHQYGVTPERVTPTGPGGRVTRSDVIAAAEAPRRVTPRARRLAAERGVDLQALPKTGVVTGADVPTVGQPADRTASRRMATARLMARAAREIPHYYVTQIVDVSAALQWLASYNADRHPRERLLPVVLFLRATVLAALEVPALNGTWDDGFTPADGVDLGVAVATRGGGLVTPRIEGAHTMSMPELMVALTELVRSAKAGRLRSSASQPGSITVSSLADGGPDALYGVIYPPQVALVGIGAVAPRPLVVESEVVSRMTAQVTLAADHRATDGRTGGRFVQVMTAALEHPEVLHET